MSKPIIRPARLSDLEAIVAIYNEAILKTTATFDTEIKTVETRRPWFNQHGGRHPLIVGEKDGQVVAWASLSAWSDRCAYSDTAENSVYVAEKYQGQGIGKELMKALVGAAREFKIHTVVARISDGNEASIRLHKRFGFKEVGIMKEVGKKFGRLIDVNMMQLMVEKE